MKSRNLSDFAEGEYKTTPNEEKSLSVRFSRLNERILSELENHILSEGNADQKEISPLLPDIAPSKILSKTAPPNEKSPENQRSNPDIVIIRNLLPNFAIEGEHDARIKFKNPSLRPEDIHGWEEEDIV
jgi:hypothetical protein